MLESKDKAETILDRLLILVKSQKFVELFSSLNDLPYLMPWVLGRVIQADFGVPVRKEIELKEEIMEIMRERGVTHTVFSITPMISLYGKVGDSDKADGLLHLMKENGIERNAAIYNSLMRCHWNDTVKVEDLHIQMIDDGVKPNVYIYDTMINTHSKSGNFEKAGEMFDLMIKEKIKPDVYIYTSMLDVYAKSGKIEKAILMFESMKRGLVTYNIMLDAYAKDLKLEQAIELFATMQKEGMLPDVVTYTTMINVYSKDVDKAIELFDSMKAEGISPDIQVYNLMIDVFAKGGMLEKAIDLFDSMKAEGISPNVVTYTTMTDAYSKEGLIEKAEETYAMMKRKGLKPSVSMFGALLDGYAKSGKHLSKMLRLVEEMKEFSVEPDISTWCIIIDGYSRSESQDDQKKAISIWKYLSGQMSHENLGLDLPVKAPSLSPDYITLCLAIDACKVCGFEKEADEVWMYGQENAEIALDSNVLTSYVEFLPTLGENGADRVIGLIMSGIKGEKMPLRCVLPDKKTIEHAGRNLRRYGWMKHAAKLNSIEV
jgi:pentatricopeptide repeat protein